MERLEKMYDIISKMDFFNQRAARELWSHKPEKIQNQDIFNRHQDLCEIKEFVDDVAELMELEEQGLLLKLPCKVGNKAYHVIEDALANPPIYISEHKIMDVSAKAVYFADDWWTFEEMQNLNAFLSREEAEAKLKEIQNETHNGK